jgi:hypothetical protein
MPDFIEVLAGLSQDVYLGEALQFIHDRSQSFSPPTGIGLGVSSFPKKGPQPPADLIQSVLNNPRAFSLRPTSQTLITGYSCSW